MKFIDLFCGISRFPRYARAWHGMCSRVRYIAKQGHVRTEPWSQPRGDVLTSTPRCPTLTWCVRVSCQPFSRAGRKVRRMTQSLFDQVIKFTTRQPRYIVLENVRGATVNDGKDFATMTAMLMRRIRGHRVLRCAIGIPQNRVRSLCRGAQIYQTMCLTFSPNLW